MALLRILLLVLLGWYAVRWLAGWLAGGGSKKKRDVKDGQARRYGELTDQKIDDADYEDL